MSFVSLVSARRTIFPPYIFFHSLHVLPTSSSVSVINHHVPISRPVYLFSDMLLVFTMSSFHRVFLFIIVVAAFFPPLNIYKPRRELFSLRPPVYSSLASRAAKGGEERRLSCSCLFFCSLTFVCAFCSLS